MDGRTAGGPRYAARAWGRSQAPAAHRQKAPLPENPRAIQGRVLFFP